MVKTPAAQGTGAGAVAGGVTGAVLGKQFGNGNGQKAMTVLGAVGGALLGNKIEKEVVRAVQRYEVSVTFEDGTTGVYSFDQDPYWQPGDKVKVVNGRITANT
ncbi:MAG: glycine zipper 2TM domain-containing protein [Limnobacter sp.]|nr:glycine zipper 2TM domain-containing protein [Limnobacter sp.]